MANTLRFRLASAAVAIALPLAGHAQTPTAAISAEPSSPDGRGPTAWYRDTLGGVLLGTGVATIGVGLYLLSSAGGASDEAGRAESYNRYMALSDSADTRQVAGEVVLISGLLLGVGALVRYLMVRSAENVAKLDQARPRALRAGLPFELVQRF